MNQLNNPSEDRQILTISEFAHRARILLEGHFQTLWLEGELSNFTCPRSGHWYFSLKDENAQVRCAMFRGNNMRVKFQPEDGMHLLVHAKVSLYEPRGDFQLIVDHIEELGIGALQRAFEQLKAKLDKVGMFDAKYKKPIPEFPNCIGVITSATGAAIRDILHVLKRRFPAIPVIVYPTLVQGDLAADQIVNAIQTANKRRECDVLILARGGGSLEDLWPFNEEIVAYEIFKSELPIVTGVGHEVDFTIADFVSDLRAPTPSAAAEIVSPNQSEVAAQITQFARMLNDEITQQIDTAHFTLTHLHKRLLQCHPARQMEQYMQQCDRLEQSLVRAQQRQIKRYHEKLQSVARALNAVNPLNILDRGFSVVKDLNNKIITHAKQLKIDQTINIQFAEGHAETVIKKIDNK